MTILAKFPGVCSACHRAIAKGSVIEWSKGAGARHVDAEACKAAAPKPAPQIGDVVINMSAVVTFLRAARERGLKFPKVAFLAPGGGELRIVLAGDTSANPGAVYVKVNDEYRGLIAPDGTVRGSLDAGARSLTKDLDLQIALIAVAADPVTAAKAYGALLGRCSFCSLPLTDEGSTEVGYGPICAKRYGLPHHPKGTPTLAVPVSA
jgi:hypothetical protein